jgi:hypothetical protein
MSDGTAQLTKRGNRALYHHSDPTDSLHLNFDGDFEGGVVVGGPKTLVEGALVSKGDMVAHKDLEVRGSTVIVGKGDGKKQGSNDANRALSHGDEDILVFNQDGDFEGGVHVHGPGLFADGKIAVGTKHTKPEADIHIKTSNAESSLMFSSDAKKQNSVYMKSVATSAAGIDMEIGSTEGSTEYGRLSVNFDGDINFKGKGNTVFERGNAVFKSGNLGVGAASAGSPWGITVETQQKAGDQSNDIALKKGSVHLFGGIYDTSSSGDYHLDLDKSGHVKALSVASGLGVGTKSPTSPYGDTQEAVAHLRDAGRPVLLLESTSETAHATVVLKTGNAQWDVDAAGTALTMSSNKKELLVLDSAGKVGIGRPNDGDYGVNVHLDDNVDSKRNDVALPHGNLRLKGKIYDTFDGGDEYYLDPSGLSNVGSVNVEEKLSFKGVSQPALYTVEVPAGDAHVAVGRSLFLNGFGGESARVTNNAVVDNKGGWALHDASKMASAIELRNNGQIEMFATKQAGKIDWELMFGVDAVKGAAFTGEGVNFGVGVKEPQHLFHMPDGEATMSLGNNMFLSGAGAVSRITANAYMKQRAWEIPRADKYSASLELKDEGGIDMYGTETAGAVQWKKMFGYNAPKGAVYAFGKMGIETENPTHTLTLPSGEHHISMGDKLFLNGEASTSRIMGNCYMDQGKLAVKDKAQQAVAIEMEAGTGKIGFGGTNSRGSDAFLKLLSLDFTGKAVSVESGRLGVRTAAPKTAVDIRGHVHLQDPSNAGVFYTPTAGPGVYFRSADAPGTYNADQERYFFGNNHRVGFGTVQPKSKLHIVHQGEETLAHLRMETAGALAFDIGASKEGLSFSTANEGEKFTFSAGASTPLRLHGSSAEQTVNDVKFQESTAVLVPGGGRAAVGGEPKGQHNLQVFGTGAFLQGTGANSGVLAFANDGGGNGFQLDYDKGIMSFGSLPPMSHLKTSADQRTFMAILDNGRVGVGTKEPSSDFAVKGDIGVSVESSAGKKWTMKTTASGDLEFSSGTGGFFKMSANGGTALSDKVSDYKMVVDGTGMQMAAIGGDKASPLVFEAADGAKGFKMEYANKKMIFGQDSDVAHMAISDEGKVGVGTKDPQHGVHVKHDNGIAVEHGSKADKWVLRTDQDATLHMEHEGKTHFSITKQGYIGMGTNAPSKGLHVEGDVYVSGKIHVDNDYLKKKAESLTPPSPTLLTSEEALLQLGEHVSAKMEDADNSYAMLHNQDGKKASEPVDYASMMAVMHRVVQDQQATIKKLSERVAALEAKA